MPRRPAAEDLLHRDDVADVVGREAPSGTIGERQMDLAARQSR
jgi:hypothetical protein